MEENNRRKVRLLLCILALLLAGLLGGCETEETSAPVAGEPVQKAETVLTIGGQAVTESETFVYIYMMQKPYETYFGNGIWQSQHSEGTTWEAWLLSQVKKQITEMEILCQRAAQADMTLSEEERDEAVQAAVRAYSVIDPEAAAKYGLTQECMAAVYEKSMLAGKFYETTTDSYDLKLSEDEAEQCEAIAVCQIYIAADDTGHVKEGQTQEALAEELAKRAADGEDFEALARAYSSSNGQVNLIFDREGYAFDADAWLEEAFVKAAWSLEKGDISPVIQTSYGYHVLKCTDVNSDSLKQQARENKLEEKKRKAFMSAYEEWLAGTVCTEEEAWEKIHVMEGI